jgi:hypothetical protein
MIAPNTRHLLPQGTLLDQIEQPLVRRFQFCVGIVNGIPIEDQFMVFGNGLQKQLEGLAEKISGSDMQIADNYRVHVNAYFSTLSAGRLEKIITI